MVDGLRILTFFSYRCGTIIKSTRLENFPCLLTFKNKIHIFYISKIKSTVCLDILEKSFGKRFCRVCNPINKYESPKAHLLLYFHLLCQIIRSIGKLITVDVFASILACIYLFARCRCPITDNKNISLYITLSFL